MELKVPGLECAGELIHTHTGANAAKLEGHLRTQLQAFKLPLADPLDLTAAAATK
jgi:hypothetical protein